MSDVRQDIEAAAKRWEELARNLTEETRFWDAARIWRSHADGFKSCAAELREILANHPTPPPE